MNTHREKERESMHKNYKINVVEKVLYAVFLTATDMGAAENEARRLLVTNQKQSPYFVEVESTHFNVEQVFTREEVLERIQGLLSGREWNAGTTQEIAELMRASGYEIKDLPS